MKKIRTAYLKTNYTCNNRCIFCYSDHSQEKTMDLNEVRENMEYILENLNFDKFILSGGEASVHPEFEEILEYIAEKIKSKFLLVTNGRQLANDSIIKSLNRFKKDKIEVSISLHGPDKATHESITRVQGSFNEAMKSIEVLIKNGIRVSVVFVITKDNFLSLPKTIETLKKEGVNEFRLRIVYPWDVNKESEIAKLLPPPVLAKEKILEAMGIAHSNKGILHIDYMPYCYISLKRYKRKSLYSFEKDFADIEIYFFDKWHQKDHFITRDCIQESQGHEFFDNLHKNEYCKDCVQPCEGLPNSYLEAGFNNEKDIFNEK